MVRRMASLPRSIMGSISRAMGDGMGFVGIGRRRNQHTNIPLQPQVLSQPHGHHQLVVPEEWAFLECFEQQYGTKHPFFYAFRFSEAMKLAEKDHKFVFMYLHSPDHPFANVFCKETLCSEFVSQFLDVNFVCWGALADRGDGLQMVATLSPGSFPCCAVIAPAPGDSIAVLQQLEGPLSPAELVEILQRTLEEQGVAFGSAKAKQEAKIQADRRLREEQDAAYLAALQIDKEKDKLHNLPSRELVQKPVVAQNTTNYGKMGNNSIKVSKQRSKVNESTSEKQDKGNANRGSESQSTQILIRFPNGERREHTFLYTDKIQSIFSYIDSLGLPGIGNYRLISNFPRRAYGVDQMRMTLKDAGLYPKASMFLEPL
ncbi:plant UBX domain-containing protein 10-like [Abrus precatorius]|uniref:Plant UBX domain-containing protein 10-like n=1 Tax=Abrus precatorius TaxID=3816 RepID=A0A8B8JHJ9_ABRPR|nr:plant UBX domain-containing protein 10-like [Abrus precatorius]